jgi:phosphoribosylanthranilate isomerase
MKVKIEGNRSRGELQRVAGAGADYAGVIVNVPRSPRAVRSEELGELCADPPIAIVLVLLDADEQTIRSCAAAARPVAIQLHGTEAPSLVKRLSSQLTCEVWKVIHLAPAGEPAGNTREALAAARVYADAGVAKLVVDTAADATRAGGTGLRSDWDVAAAVVRESPVPVILAGGLRPENVGDAVRRVRPHGVDVASGVERERGVKDWRAVRAFVQAARAAAGEPT